MTDVLDQSEIDALMSAVSEGEVEEPGEQAQIFSRHRRDLDDVEIKDYDFKRPERISKDQMRALQTLHEAFARNFGAALSGFLRTIVEIRVASAEQMTYSEFTSSLPNPTSFNLIEAPILDGQLCLEISPLIIYPLIDRLLGGSNENIFIPQRPLTIIETRLIKKILERGVAALTEAWETVKKIDFKLGALESKPQIVQIVPPNEVVVVVGLEIKMSTRAGTANLCIPYNVIEPRMEDLSAQSWFRSGQVSGTGEYAERIRGRLNSALLNVSGVLAETSITLRDVLDLAEGDLIMTDTKASSHVTLRVEGAKKLEAYAGPING